MISLTYKKINKKLINYLEDSIKNESYDELIQYILKEENNIKRVYDDEIESIFFNHLKDKDIPEKLYDLINEIDNKNRLVLLYQIKLYYSNNDTDRFLGLIENNKKLLSVKGIREKFDNFLGSKPVYDKLLYLSKMDIYDDTYVEKYIINNYNFNDFKNIVDNFTGNNDYENAEIILKKCIELKRDINCYYLLGSIYIKTNNKKALNDTVNYLLINDSKKPNEKLSKYLYFEGKYGMAIEYADKLDRGNKILADSYYYNGNYGRALEIYKNIYYNIDKGVIYKIIEIEHIIGDYGSLIVYLKSLEKMGTLDKNFCLYKIEAEMKLDMYIDAEDDINLYTKKYGNDKALLYLKLEYYRHIENESMEYNMANEILKTGEKDINVFNTIINYQYNNENYTELEKFIEEHSIKDNFMGKYVASLIYNNKMENVIEEIRNNTKLLNNGEVIDSLFNAIKSDKNIKLFDSIDYKNTLLEFVINYLRGNKNIDYLKYFDIVDRGKSKICAYIIAVNGIDFKNNVKKKYVKDILSKGKFSNINYIIKSIFDAYSGNINDDTRDLKYFLYPVTDALIKTGKYDTAKNMIESLISKNPDPFYYYYRGLIEYHKNNYGDSEKYVNEAIEILKNADFFSLKLILAMKQNSSINKLLDEAFNLNFYSIFGDAYEFILYNKIDSTITEYFFNLNIHDINLYRIKRNLFGEYKSKVKYSALTLAGDYNEDDMIKQYNILKNSDVKIGVKFLRFFKFKTYKTDEIIANYYYSVNDYYNSFKYYNDAFIRNNDVVDNVNFIKIRNDNEIYNNAINKFIENGDYYNTVISYFIRKEYNKIEKIIDKIYDNKKIMEFLIENAWNKNYIKNNIIKIFNEKNDRITGELISKKFDDDEDYYNEIPVLKKLHELYNDDLMILDKLISALSRNNEKEDALSILYNKFHETKNLFLFNRLVSMYYNFRDYNSVMKIYNSNYIDRYNIKYFIFSSIKLFMYENYKTLSEKYRDLIDKSAFNEINNKLSSSYKFKNLLSWAKKLFEYEYKEDKKMKFEEYYKVVPDYISENLYKFIENMEPYTFINKYVYNDMSRDIIRKLYENGSVVITKIKINKIYNIVKDVITAKNFYIFIDRSLSNVYNIKFNSKYEYILDKINRNNINPMELVTRFDIGLIDALNIIDILNKSDKNVLQ